MSENKKRSIVRLSNKISQKANDQMSLLSKRISYAINLKAIENKSSQVTLTLNQLIQMLGLSNAGSNYQRIQKELSSALKDCFLSYESQVETEDGIKNAISLMYIYKRIHQIEGENTYIFVLDPEYYENITTDKNFYNNQYDILLSLNSVYSLKLYEYVSSRRNEYTLYGKDPVASLHQLYVKLLNDMTSCPEWKRFKENILDPAVKEINKKTDLIIKYETIKEKRKVIAVRFHIIEKNKAKEAETDLAKSSEEDLLTYHDSNGCKLNGYEEKILLEIDASHKRTELARYKKDMPEKYSFYTKKGEYSDFHVILMFVKNDIDEFIGRDIDTIEQMKQALNELGLEEYVVCVRLVQKSNDALTYENVIKKYQERKDMMEILKNSKEKPARKRKKKTARKPKKEEIKQEGTDVQEISADDLPW